MNIYLLFISVVLYKLASSNNYCIGPEHDQPCYCAFSRYGCQSNKNQCIWTSHQCLPISSTTTTTTIAPSEPTVAHTLTCDETIENVYDSDSVIFKLVIPHNTPFLSINACQSNFHTMLDLYYSLSFEISHIISADHECIDNNYGSSMVIKSDGLSKGTYYLKLSSNSHDIDSNSVYHIKIDCDTPKPTKSPNEINDISSKLSEIMDIHQWWQPTPRPTHIPFDQLMQEKHDEHAKCSQKCDAFRVELLYFGKLSEYNTDYIYYESIDPSSRRLREVPLTNDIIDNDDKHQDASNNLEEDTVCYTYRVSRQFDEGECMADVNYIVLGACKSDYNRINYADLDRLIIKEYGGEMYHGFNGFGVNEITGIKVDVEVNTKPIDFTLCMKGVNDAGYTSDFVQFKRENIRSYSCLDRGNDGLPCLNDEYKNHDYIPNNGDWFGAAMDGVHGTHFDDVQSNDNDNDKKNVVIFKHQPNSVWSSILFGILMIVLTIMVLVALFYACISYEKSPLHVMVQKWGPYIHPFSDHDMFWNPTTTDLTLSSSDNDEVNLLSLPTLSKHHSNETQQSLISALDSMNVQKDESFISLSSDDDIDIQYASTTKGGKSDSLMTSTTTSSSNPFGDSEEKIDFLSQQIMYHIRESQTEELSTEEEEVNSVISRESKSTTGYTPSMIIKEIQAYCEETGEFNKKATKKGKKPEKIEKVPSESAISDETVVIKESSESRSSQSTPSQYGTKTRHSREATFDTSDGVTILSVYDAYSLKDNSLPQHDDDDDDMVDGYYDTFSDDGHHHGHDRQDSFETVSTFTGLNSNVINAVRYYK